MLKEKLKRLGYTKVENNYLKWIHNWCIVFKLDYYENACDEMVEEIVDYYISPAEIIDRNEINKVLDILEHDLKELGQC